MSLPADHAERIARARLSLEGLSLGDAFGERYFAHPHTVEQLIAERALARAPWVWTDDTAMALSIVEVLDRHAGIDADALAHAFARRYLREPGRGYGGGAHQILGALVVGVPWPTAARLVFDQLALALLDEPVSHLAHYESLRSSTAVTLPVPSSGAPRTGR